ncbi:hypothetical protein HN587_00040 [Candidatus Woesearchaeota archaeon]|nr:hypothetical protein [Candidatus Woesearchaeota archaeon]
MAIQELKNDFVEKALKHIKKNIGTILEDCSVTGKSVSIDVLTSPTLDDPKLQLVARDEGPFATKYEVLLGYHPEDESIHAYFDYCLTFTKYSGGFRNVDAPDLALLANGSSINSDDSGLNGDKKQNFRVSSKVKIQSEYVVGDRQKIDVSNRGDVEIYRACRNAITEFIGSERAKALQSQLLFEGEQFYEFKEFFSAVSGVISDQLEKLYE